MKWTIARGIVRGLVTFVTMSILTGIFIFLGIDPGELVAKIIGTAPAWAWLTHPVTRVVALILGGLFGFWTYKLFQNWPANRSRDHWAERNQLEISVLANVSAGRQPTDGPIDKGPENSRLRELKGVIDSGELDAEINGDKANVWSMVTLHDFTIYVAATNKPYWVEVLHRWQAGRTPPAGELPSELKGKRTPLLKFLEEANKRGWDMLNPGGYEAFDLIHGISEAAGLGDLVVLGKKMDRQIPSFTYTGRRHVIPAELWQTHCIDPTSCLRLVGPGDVAGFTDDNENTRTKCDQGNPLAFQDYADLYLETAGLLDWLKNDADDYRGHTEKVYGD